LSIWLKWVLSLTVRCSKDFNSIKFNQVMGCWLSIYLGIEDVFDVMNGGRKGATGKSLNLIRPLADKLKAIIYNPSLSLFLLLDIMNHIMFSIVNVDVSASLQQMLVRNCHCLSNFYILYWHLFFWWSVDDKQYWRGNQMVGQQNKRFVFSYFY